MFWELIEILFRVAPRELRPLVIAPIPVLKDFLNLPISAAAVRGVYFVAPEVAPL